MNNAIQVSITIGSTVLFGTTSVWSNILNMNYLLRETIINIMTTARINIPMKNGGNEGAQLAQLTASTQFIKASFEGLHTV